MNFKLIKKDTNKIILWFGSITFSFLSIILIILFTVDVFKSKEKVLLAVESTFSMLFIYFAYIIFIANKSILPIMVDPLKCKNEEEKEFLVFKLSKASYFLIILIAIILFILIIICYKFTSKTSFKSSATISLWINIPLLIYNIIFGYLFLSLFVYKLNQNINFKDNFLASLNNEDTN